MAEPKQVPKTLVFSFRGVGRDQSAGATTPRAEEEEKRPIGYRQNISTVTHVTEVILQASQRELCGTDMTADPWLYPAPLDSPASRRFR